MVFEADINKSQKSPSPVSNIRIYILTVRPSPTRGGTETKLEVNQSLSSIEPKISKLGRAFLQDQSRVEGAFSNFLKSFKIILTVVLNM